MLPEDILDLVIAVILLFGLVILGAKFFGTDEEAIIYEGNKLELKDEAGVFFLNFLRTEVDGKTIADLIILGEDDDKLVKTLREELEKTKYFKYDHEYGLVITYSDKGEPIEIGCTYEIKERGVEQSLPSLDNRLIKLEFVLQGDECTLI